jgi:hypothetical protein
VSIEPVELLTNKIMDRYNKDPVDWAVLKDLKGNMLVTGPAEGYMLKIITINPQEYTGIGVQVDSPRELRTLVEGAPSFGYRPLAKIQVEELLNSFRQSERNTKLISEILEKKPVPTLDIQKKRPIAVLTGPVIAHPDISTISKSQRELELRLRIGAEKLFRQKYPHRAEMYR